MLERLLARARAKRCRAVPLRSSRPDLVLVDDELGGASCGVNVPGHASAEPTRLTPSSPTGPRACVLPVETPTSVPNPYRNPSANRVLALTYTPAESIPRLNARAFASDSVTIASVWCDECELMCAMAAERDGTAFTARTRSRNSVS